MRQAIIAAITCAAFAGLALAAPPNAGAISAAYAAADRAFAGGDLTLARDLTRDLTEKFPEDPQTWLRLAQIEERRGAFNEALAAYDGALDVEAAFSIDGGVTLARIRYQRAALLLAEAERELAKSAGVKLGGSDDRARDELARVLAQADVIRQAKVMPRAPARDNDSRAHGYVIDTKETQR